MSDPSRLSWALVLSMLLHGLLLSLLPLIQRAHIEFPRPAELLDVDVLPLPKPAAPPPPLGAAPVPVAPAPPAIPLPKQQIVSPPDQGEEKEPENARFLSDRNNTVKEEQIHRGEPLPGDPDAVHKAPPQPVAKSNPERSQPERERPERAHAAEPERARSNQQLAALPKLDQLLPSAGDLIREGMVPSEAAPPTPAVEQASKQRDDLLSHGDPWRGRGRGGSMDFLPAIREGDVTLLNTKAEQFAPFVRRVALRVFGDFIMLLRRSYASGEVGAEEQVTVEAIMDKSGHLVSLTTKERSVTSALATDRSLQSALRDGFFDRNPPPGAESNDGNIHFMFMARVVAAADASGHRVPTWALLGTGLL